MSVTTTKRKPANRQKTGFRGPSPDVGKATQFKAGEPSPNPSGRPKRRPVTDAYLEAMMRPLPDNIRRQLGLEKGANYLQAMALGTLRSGVKGNHGAAREIREATEGKSTQRVELTGESGGPIVAALDKETTLAAIREAYGLAANRPPRPPRPDGEGLSEEQPARAVPVSDRLD